MRFLLLMISMLVAATAFADEHFDLLIRHGKIIDGTGNTWFYGDIGITGDRVAAIGDLSAAKAAREIDATNLVVTPGFIDVHTHADTDLYKQPQAENFVRDGATTIVTGNCGYGVTDVGRYFAHLREHHIALNVATLIGHNNVLKAVKGDSGDPLTPEQMEKAKAVVRQAMQDGAVGFSTGLIYTPGKYSSTEEIIALASVAGEMGGIYTSHMRSESTEILKAIDEALRVGREAHCRVEISHFKLPSDVAAKIGGAKTTIQKVLDARAAGQEVWADQYPYTASNTGIATMMPDWVYRHGKDEALKILNDPAQVAKILAEMKQEHEVTRVRESLAYVVIASCSAHPGYDGKSILQIAQMRKLKTHGELLSTEPQPLPAVTMEDQYRTVIDIIRDGGAAVLFHTMDEREVEDILKFPLISIASDSGVREFGVGSPHPRGYGCNARVLGKYVRERHVISLEEAIRKMTSQPALAFRIKSRGLLRAGYFADINIFDPAKITDLATFEKPHQYSTGFRAVIVNGMAVVEDDHVTDALPGVPVMGPGH